MKTQLSKEDQEKRLEAFRKDIKDILTRYSAELEVFIETDSSERYQSNYIEVSFDGDWWHSEKLFI